MENAEKLQGITSFHGTCSKNRENISNLQRFTTDLVFIDSNADEDSDDEDCVTVPFRGILEAPNDLKTFDDFERPLKTFEDFDRPKAPPGALKTDDVDRPLQHSGEVGCKDPSNTAEKGKRALNPSDPLITFDDFDRPVQLSGELFMTDLEFIDSNADEDSDDEECATEPFLGNGLLLPLMAGQVVYKDSSNAAEKARRPPNAFDGFNRPMTSSDPLMTFDDFDRPLQLSGEVVYKDSSNAAEKARRPPNAFDGFSRPMTSSDPLKTFDDFDRPAQLSGEVDYKDSSNAAEKVRRPPNAFDGFNRPMTSSDPLKPFDDFDRSMQFSGEVIYKDSSNTAERGRRPPNAFDGFTRPMTSSDPLKPFDDFDRPMQFSGEVPKWVVTPKKLEIGTSFEEEEESCPQTYARECLVHSSHGYHRSEALCRAQPEVVFSQAALNTSIWEAISDANYDATRKLLELGADPNAPTEHGSRLLFRSVIKAKDSSIVKLLLVYGASTRAADTNGNQVMQFWVRSVLSDWVELIEIARCLVRAGADIDAARNKNGMTPLHHIAVRHNNRRGWLDFHKGLTLVRMGANIMARTLDNQLAVDFLAPNSRRSTACLRVLLANGIPQGVPHGSWPKCHVINCVWCS